MPSSSGSSSAYDMGDISIIGPTPLPEHEDQQSILSGVPSQTSSRSRTSSTLSDHDRELRIFPLALTSKLFFFFGCAMYLWLSIDDLQWAHDARTIPDSVLEADDDVTWRQFRTRQNSPQSPTTTATTSTTPAATSSGGIATGYTRPSSSTTPEYDEENEITWSQFRDNQDNGSGRTLRRLLRNQRRTIATNIKNRKLQEGTEAGFGFHTGWDDLPFSKKIAATILGYDELSWSSGGTTFTDSIPWSDLDEEQRNAATTLGYTQYLWDMLRGFQQPLTSPPSSRQQTNEANPTSQEWGNFFWSELPQEIQVEAAKLGYDESIWNNGERTYADDLFWDELTSEQQYAASVLGYSKETWDVYSTTTLTDIYRNPATSSSTTTTTTTVETTATTAAKAETSSSTTSNNTATATDNNTEIPSGTTPPNGNWRAVQWNALSDEIQGGAIALGYTEELWNSGARISTESYFWDDLSNAQRQAATAIFGYTETSWNASDKKWQKVAWNELPSNVRSEAMILGYDERLWNSGADIDTKTWTWDELSGEQQNAAFTVFGYTEQSWNGAGNTSKAQSIKNDGGGRGGGRGGADDDYVFSVEKDDENIWVSKYQIVYFVASICFFAVGILDIIRERRSYHLLMAIAGIFGVLASMWVETSFTKSNIFNCFSAHFFVIQAFTTFFYRPELRKLLSGPFKNAVWLADISFFSGALMKAILSYFYFKEGARENLAIARADSFASLLFFFCAFIFIVTTPLIFLRNTKEKPYL